MSEDIEMNITWVLPDGVLLDDSTLYGPFARLLCPDVYSASKRAREIIALTDRMLSSGDVERSVAKDIQRKRELEAELALINASIGKYSSTLPVSPTAHPCKNELSENAFMRITSVRLAVATELIYFAA